jgi:hypothetical protein
MQTAIQTQNGITWENFMRDLLRAQNAREIAQAWATRRMYRRVLLLWGPKRSGKTEFARALVGAGLIDFRFVYDFEECRDRGVIDPSVTATAFAERLAASRPRSPMLVLANSGPRVTRGRDGVVSLFCPVSVPDALAVPFIADRLLTEDRAGVVGWAV